MSTTGPKYPRFGDSSSQSPWSDNDWLNPESITATGGTIARITANTFDSPDQSYILRGYNFDFSDIPDNANVCGVSAAVNAYAVAGQVGGAIDVMQLLTTAGAQTGTNQCSTMVGLASSTANIVAKGGTADLWGLALTPAWVKNSGFGIGFGVSATGANADVFCDYLTLEVIYDIPPSTAQVAGSATGLGSMSGGLLGSGALAAAPAGSAMLYAPLSLIWSINASIIAQCTVNGQLFGSGKLESVIPGAALITANLVEGAPPPGPIQAILAGTSTVAANLIDKIAADERREWLGDVISPTMTPGDSGAEARYEWMGLPYKAPNIAAVGATIAASSSVDAHARGVLNLAGAFAGTSLIVGNLVAAQAGELIATTAGTSTITAQLTGTGALQGLSVGASTFTGVISASTAAQTILAGTSMVTASLVGTGNVQTLLTGVGNLAASIGGGVGIAATIPGTSTLTAQIVSSASIQAVLAGAATAAGNLAGSGQLQAAPVGVGAVSAGLTGSGQLRGLVAGTGTLAGGLVGYAAGQALAQLAGTGAVAKANLLGVGTMRSRIDGVGTLTVNIPSAAAMRVGGFGTLWKLHMKDMKIWG